jgi:hypothetical protein
VEFLTLVRARDMLTLAMLSALIAAAAGCTAPVRRFQPAIDPDTLDETRFLHYLPGVPVATLDEGCRAVLLLAEDAPPDTFAARRDALVAAGALPAEIGPDAGNRILTHGTLARMLRTQCRLPRGFNEHVLVPWGVGRERYALRACVAEGLLPPAGVHEPVTGGQLLAAFSHAEAYLERVRGAPSDAAGSR